MAKKKQYIQLVGAGPGRFLRMGPKQRSLHPPGHRSGSHRFDSRALQESIKCISHALVVRSIGGGARFPFPGTRSDHHSQPPLAMSGRPVDGVSGRVEGGFDVTTSHASTRPAGRYVQPRNLYRVMTTAAVMMYDEYINIVIITIILL